MTAMLASHQFHASISPMFTTFRGGQSGAWRVTGLAPVKGEALMHTPALSVVHSPSIALPILPSQTAWRLAGVISHARYVERAEKEALEAVQARARPHGGNPRSADPDQEIGRRGGN